MFFLFTQNAEGASSVTLIVKENGHSNPIGSVWFVFYDISTILGYSMPSLVFTYVIWKHIYRHAQLNDQTALFLTIQFSMSQQS